MRKKSEREPWEHETADNRVQAAEGALLEAEAPATERSVAQPSAQSCLPASSLRLSTIRPGHRSLAQSVHTHLKRGSVNQRSSPKGTRPEFHPDPLPSAQSDSSSAPALLARLSDFVLPTQRTEHNPESDRSLPQSIPISSELFVQARALTAQTVGNSTSTDTSISTMHIPGNCLRPFCSLMLTHVTIRWLCRHHVKDLVTYVPSRFTPSRYVSRLSCESNNA